MIVILNKKSIFICFIARILTFFNCKVGITSSSESIFFQLLKKLGFKIHCKSLLYLEMSSQNIKNLGMIDGDFNKISNKCVKNLYQKVDILENLEFFFWRTHFFYLLFFYGFFFISKTS